MSKSKAIRTTVRTIKWGRLKAQRETVRRLASNDISLAKDLYGIVHLLDALHEAAEVDHIGDPLKRAKYKEK